MFTGSKSKETKTKTKPKTEVKKPPPGPHKSPKPESNWEAATVKFVSPYGFALLARGEGTKDIYVHKSTLKRCGLTSLSQGQAVEVRWATVPKGLEAAEIRLAK